jgi:hypothetical protein
MQSDKVMDRSSVFEERDRIKWLIENGLTESPIEFAAKMDMAGRTL